MCTHSGIVGLDGDVVRQQTSQRDELLKQLRESTTPGSNFDENVRFPTPPVKAAKAELWRRGVAAESYKYEDLDAQVDDLIEDEEVTLADGVDSAAEVVGTGAVRQNGMSLNEA